LETKIGTVTLNPSVDKYLYLEDFSLGKLNRANRTEKYAGGKGINVSLALKNIGIPSLVLGCQGGENGRFIIKELARQSIGHQLVEIAGETRSNLKLLGSQDLSLTEINEPGPFISPRELEEIKTRVVNCGKDLSYLVISGSLPSGVPAGFYAEIILKLRPFGTKVILDADQEQLKLGVAENPFLIKPNRHELEELQGTALRDSGDFKRSARNLVEKGINYVIISDGSTGALFATNNQFIWVKSPVVKSGSPVGCGDAMLAGIVAGFIRQMPFEETARLAVAMATATAMKPGTSFPDFEEVQAVMSKVEVIVI
jgi:1-phosphofructokinase